MEVVLERGEDQGLVVAELGPKEGFGEMALLTDQPRSATVTASTDVDTWSLSATAFQVLLSENLSLALHFNRILSQRLRTLQERIVPWSTVGLRLDTPRGPSLQCTERKML